MEDEIWSEWERIIAAHKLVIDRPREPRIRDFPT